MYLFQTIREITAPKILVRAANPPPNQKGLSNKNAASAKGILAHQTAVDRREAFTSPSIVRAPHCKVGTAVRVALGFGRFRVLQKSKSEASVASCLSGTIGSFAAANMARSRVITVLALPR